MRRMATVFANDSLLLLTAAIWGMAFVAQRAGMDHVGPFTYNALRFALGALALVPIILIRRTHAAPPQSARLPQPLAGTPARAWGAIPAGLLAGVVLFLGASFQQAGIVSTTAGKAGFITGLYVVLVPLAGLLWGQRAGVSAWAGAFLCVAGLFLLSLTDALTIERGDLLVLISAFLWAAHVQIVGWLSPRVDPFRLSCAQFAVCALLCSCGALIFERPALDGIRAAAWPILYGGVMSAGIAFTLQIVAQRKAPPAHAAILLSLESVFAAIGGSIVLGERLGARGVAGCAIMFAGMVVSQVPLIVSSFRHGGQSAGSL
jgi:drug/metabolite transporter (DMT)-like permease